MTAIESKEEISDTDSGIIVHSGPDSPTSPLKDGTHTRALKLKHQALEERLELCLLELRNLCIREAELTGKLPSDFPLMPDEKPPRVRRRIGASFKLDENLILQNNKEDSELHALETELALQRQIFEAARKLSLEDNLSKPQKKSRAQQCKREEKKVKDLAEAVFQHRVKSECNSPRINVTANQHRDLNMSDDSSLSDVVALDDEVDSPCPLSPPALGHPFTDPLHQTPKPLQSCPVSSSRSSVDSERTPIQSAPWRESSLDHPFNKNNKLLNNTGSSSPASGHVSSDGSRPLPSPFKSSSSVRYSHSTSAPSTPELHVRRQCSQSFRLPKSKPLSVENNRGRGRLPQRRPEFILRSPQYSPLRLSHSSSEDTGSEHSSTSSSSCYISSPGREGPTEIPKLCPPPYGFHYGAHKSVSSPSPNNKTLRRNQSNKEVSDSPLSPQDVAASKRFLSPPPVRSAQRQNQSQDRGPLSPRKATVKPPPPYRLVRTPSLKEYPNHAFRLLPREIVSEELKSWHQRNQQQQKFRPGGEQGVTSPTSPHMPLFTPGSGNLVLQRASDGTPLQWFVAEDSEIVSQV